MKEKKIAIKLLKMKTNGEGEKPCQKLLYEAQGKPARALF